MAKQQILELPRTGIPRSSATELASLARRLSLPYLSLEFMRPIIHPRIPIQPEPTQQEYSVYAGALAKIGAHAEATTILKRVDASQIPEVYLHKSMILFQKWNYAAAIPLLKKYVAHNSLSEYERAIAKVNLAAAYVIERKVAEADVLLTELRETTQSAGYRLLLGNALELSAQLEFKRGNYAEVRRFLHSGHTVLKQMATVSEFFIRKWMSILDVTESKGREGLAELESIRQEALSRGHWETVRECDFHQAIATHDAELFTRVYFGTPFPRYRKIMKAQVDFPLQLPSAYDWNPCSAVSRSEVRLFDMEKAEEADRDVRLSAGHVVHQAFLILTKDFYRTVSLGTLFSELFPKEYFNPHSSPARVRQVIQRLRDWFLTANIPLDVDVSKSEFKLKGDAPYLLRVHLTYQPRNRQTGKLETLKAAWPYKSFSADEAAKELQCSHRAVSRLLSWALKNKKIIRSGQGRSTRYRFSK
ncbi:MAG: hypothetical protein NDI61_09110 [Bdellovibrionaceae bacterium]|nr:hypothetical protein [Pseudobdellovibrionaceae bacterium]